MTNLKEIQEFLKYATEEQRLELIRLCNLENTKSKVNVAYSKLSSSHHCPHCGSNKINKTGQPTRHCHNLFACFSCCS